jgi:PAS domain S-box-containing protein
MKEEQEQTGQQASTRASLELLYRVSRQVASTLDLPTILEKILSLAMENIGATSGSIIIINEQEQPIESAIIVEDRLIHHSLEELKKTLDEGLAGWVLEETQSVHIPDTSQDHRWLRRPDDRETATGAKSAVAVPILARDQKVGVATFVHPEPYHLTTDHLHLVQAIADQAGVAVLNARLFEESQKQARVMTALAKSAKAFSSSLKLDEVLQNILYQIQQALQVEVVSLALIDQEDHTLTFQAAICSRSQGQSPLIGQALDFGEDTAGWVAEHGQGMIINDTRSDPRFDSQNSPYKRYHPTALVSAPIFLRDQVIGVLEAINPKSHKFKSDALLVLSGIGSLAGSSIQNAQLFEDLRAAHNRYQDIFEHSPDPIIITDLDGVILNTNRRTLKVTGYKPRELVEKNISTLHEVDWDEIGDSHSLPIDQTRSYESILVTQDQEKIPVQVIAHQIIIGDQPRLEWTLRDITERVELDQLREDMLSMIYHDLRSPLSNVISSLDVIEASLDLEKDPDVKSLFEIAVRSTQRIQRLTQSLLDINRLEAGRPITNQVLTDPDRLITNAYQALVSQINAKQLEVKLQSPQDISPVYGDPDMLERVLINLVENAVKFSPNQSELEIGVQEDQDVHCFWVRDSGPGVDPEFHDLIFNKFKRLPSDQNIKGLGLGLAFCRLTVEGHGGKIWVENAPRGGSIFTFTIPTRDNQHQ